MKASRFRLVMVLLTLLWSLNVGRAQVQEPPRLSEASYISVLTMGPDPGELYAAFGHSAIRVVDPANGIDRTYNYGTFDFDRPNFYLNFTRGYLYYRLSVGDYPNFERFYKYFGRFIHEQILELNRTERQLLFDYLENNALPENAGYFYDYFYDNCATRIRDVLIAVFGDRLRFDGTYIMEERTIRELTDLYIRDNVPWGDLGIDICLGLPMDKTASPFEHMFLPDYIEAGFANAYISIAGGRERPLVKQTRVLYEGRDIETSTLIRPATLFWFVLLIIAGLSYQSYRSGRPFRGLDFTLFGLTGLLGLLLVLLWFATNHVAAANNLNLLWAFPLHIVAAFAVLSRSTKEFWVRYFRIIAIAMGILLLTWAFLPQKLHYSLIPIAIAIGLRAAMLGWVRSKNVELNKRVQAQG